MRSYTKAAKAHAEQWLNSIGKCSHGEGPPMVVQLAKHEAQVKRNLEDSAVSVVAAQWRQP